jgi:translation elongation factor P/translation initiation factor 5A
MTMTVEEARLLKKGDFIFYNDVKYKVLHIKECRSANTNEIYINIKCKRGNETLWLMNKFATR